MKNYYYLRIPKSASASTKEAIVSSHHCHFFKTSQQHNPEQGYYDYFAFVRNPYDRFLSAWYHYLRTPKTFTPYLKYLQRERFISEVLPHIANTGRVNNLFISSTEFCKPFKDVRFFKYEQDLQQVLDTLSDEKNIHSPTYRSRLNVSKEEKEPLNSRETKIIDVLYREDFTLHEKSL